MSKKLLLKRTRVALLLIFLVSGSGVALGKKTAGTSDNTTAAKSTAAAKGAPVDAQPAQVLDPSQFFGETQAAYEAAKECPELCANLFCYCGCDQTDHHRSLLDCFTSDHSADCQICRDEVFLALGMKKQGKTLAEIQTAVDAKYSAEYPFDRPTENLKAYRARRDGKQVTDPTKKPEPAAAPKLKAGKKAGNCCGNKGSKGS